MSGLCLVYVGSMCDHCFVYVYSPTLPELRHTDHTLRLLQDPAQDPPAARPPAARPATRPPKTKRGVKEAGRSEHISDIRHQPPSPRTFPCPQPEALQEPTSRNSHFCCLLEGRRNMFSNIFQTDFGFRAPGPDESSTRSSLPRRIFAGNCLL